MADYIINEADFTDKRRISELEARVSAGSINPVRGVVKKVSFGFVRMGSDRDMIGPAFIVQFYDKKEPNGIAFEGTLDRVGMLLDWYGLNKVESFQSSSVYCYLDPDTQKIFAITCPVQESLYKQG